MDFGPSPRSQELQDRLWDFMHRRVPPASQGVIRKWIAESRIEIEQARLLVLRAAWHMDTTGNKAARNEIGGAGVSGVTPLARMYANLRTLRIADGPDEVQKRTIARRELQKYAGAE